MIDDISRQFETTSFLEHYMENSACDFLQLIYIYYDVYTQKWR